MDTTLARVKAQFAKELQVTGLPGSDPLSHAPVLAIKMRSTSCKACWHHVTCLVECLLGNIPQERLVESLKRLVVVCKHIPRCRLAFIYTQVIVAVHKTTGKSAKEYSDLKRRHIRITFDYAVFIAVAIQK